MLAYCYILWLLNDMKVAVQKTNFGGQILHRSPLNSALLKGSIRRKTVL